MEDFGLICGSCEDIVLPLKTSMHILEQFHWHASEQFFSEASASVTLSRFFSMDDNSLQNTIYISVINFCTSILLLDFFLTFNKLRFAVIVVDQMKRQLYFPVGQ